MKTHTMMLMALGLTSLSAYSATYIAVDQLFSSAATISAANGGNDSGLNTFTSTGYTGDGTNAMSINYAYTMDLSLIGGSGTETLNFSVDYTSAGTLGFFGAQVAVVGGDTTATDPGESITATINFTPTTVFTDVTFNAFQSYGAGDISVNSGTAVTNDNPYVVINSNTFTYENVDVNAANRANIGYMTLNVVTADSVAVPEPSSTALVGLGGLAVLLRRRKM
ncbi:PEP-CTERM sorting domain-containing protein [Rubritalea marina]|uniref:PEP-CTERM sorting domain-containing protein n=1 Tax=Rubritalea marina TaxID=361055 RepID=UPI00039FA784|nr:PEP-CTERM sorting domain-containing protein [Rubritalea marina]